MIDEVLRKTSFKNPKHSLEDIRWSCILMIFSENGWYVLQSNGEKVKVLVEKLVEKYQSTNWGFYIQYLSDDQAGPATSTVYILVHAFRYIVERYFYELFKIVMRTEEKFKKIFCDHRKRDIRGFFIKDDIYKDVDKKCNIDCTVLFGELTSMTKIKQQEKLYLESLNLTAKLIKVIWWW